MDKNKDCGCDEKKDAAKNKDFKYDRTGYNVDIVVGMSENQFVDHPMHNHNYTDLEVPERIELFKRIYRAILASVGIEISPSKPLEVPADIVSETEIEPNTTPAIEPE